MKTMCKTRGGRTSERDKIGNKRWTSDAKKGKKGRNMILFTTCEGPSLDRVWAVSHWLTNNNNLTWDWCITWYRHVSKNIIFNLYIACVKYMCISSDIYHAVHTRKASQISKTAVDNCGKGVGNFYLSYQTILVRFMHLCIISNVSRL